METKEAEKIMEGVIRKENQLEHIAKDLSLNCEIMGYKIDPQCDGFPDECKICEVPIYYNLKL